jgi:1,2-diacylglycerol 3-beta-galactosyltransferase
VRARRRHARGVPVLTVVTDLVTSHAAWRAARVDQMAVPTVAVRQRGGRHGGRRGRGDGLAVSRCVETGLPVTSGFRNGPLSAGERAALRRALGVPERRFLAVLTGGGEGAGGMARRAAAIVRSFEDIGVVAICGRNLRLRRRLARLTSQLPGQEQGNGHFVADVGAGLHVPRRRQLLRHLAELRRDPAALTVMRTASAGLGRPGAAARVAQLLAGLTDAGLTDAGLTAASVAQASLTDADLAGMRAGRHK